MSVLRCSGDRPAALHKVLPLLNTLELALRLIPELFLVADLAVVVPKLARTVADFIIAGI